MQLYKTLSLIDLSIFFLWLVCSIGCIFFARIKNVRNENNSSYILMGRKLTLPLFITTLVSSWYGGIFGTTQIAYEHGIYSFISQGIFWYLAYFIFAFFFIKKIHQKNAITFPDLIEKNFGKRAAKLATLVLLFKTLPVVYALSLGALLQSIFGLNFTAAIIVATSAMTLYTAFGNFKTIVYSDFLQFCFMYTGVVIIVIFSLFKLGNLNILIQKLPEYYFQPSGKHSISTMLFWLFIAFSATIINPVFYQRCMAAATPKIAKNGLLISIIFWIIFDICTTLGGMYARIHIPTTDSLNAYLLFGLDILPLGFKGLFLAAITATIISTFDSFLFTTSTFISYDLLKNNRWQARSLRIYSVLTAGLLTLIACFFFNGDIERIWLISEGYFGALLVIPILWSYLIPIKISDIQFLITASFSISVMLSKDILLPTYDLETFYFGTISTILGYTLFSLIKMSYSSETK